MSRASGLKVGAFFEKVATSLREQHAAYKADGRADVVRVTITKRDLKTHCGMQRIHPKLLGEIAELFEEQRDFKVIMGADSFVVETTNDPSNHFPSASALLAAKK